MIAEDRIVEVASQMFVQFGVKTVTMDRLARELHTSKRTLYSQFEDKTQLIKACLEAYHSRISSENVKVIGISENAIEAMAHIHQRIVRRASFVSSNFFMDIQHYYPGVLEDSYRKHGHYGHQQAVKLAKWGIEDGIFRDDMDLEVSVKTVMALLQLLKDNRQFPVDTFSKERLTFGIMLPYLRGLCTEKGTEILSMQEELFRITL